MSENLISVNNVSVNFDYQENFISKKQKIHAVNNINIKIKKGSFFGLVGESGSGKTTLMKTIYGDQDLDAGELWNYLISSRSEYDPEGMIISKIDAHKIEYFRGGSGDSPTSLTRSAFSQKLSRLRKNPPKVLTKSP